MNPKEQRGGGGGSQPQSLNCTSPQHWPNQAFSQYGTANCAFVFFCAFVITQRIIAPPKLFAAASSAQANFKLHAPCISVVEDRYNGSQR